MATAQEQLILKEVVVTARKREESLQQVLIAITVFTETTIERAGSERPNELWIYRPIEAPHCDLRALRY